MLALSRARPPGVFPGVFPGVLQGFAGFRRECQNATKSPGVFPGKAWNCDFSRSFPGETTGSAVTTGKLPDFLPEKTRGFRRLHEVSPNATESPSVLQVSAFLQNASESPGVFPGFCPEVSVLSSSFSILNMES